MKPHPYRLLFAAALAGCSSIPLEIEQGTKAAYTSTLPPRDVVACMSRNQATNGFALTPQIVEGDKGDLLYALRASDGDVHLFAEINPLGIGSKMTVYTISFPIRDRIEAAILKGC